MKILLVNPKTPVTFWSTKNALKFISKKSSEPPLGLLTLASLLPDRWDRKLVDMNVTLLKDRDLLWADYVFIGGMDIQKESFEQVVARCNELGVKVVAGGPMCTTGYQDFPGVDYFVLNEAEITLPLFVADLEKGKPQRIYTTDEFSDMPTTPIPQWNLLDMKTYAVMDIQYSRGCPYNCDFCSITMLYGHKPRIKSSEQFLKELEGLYLAGWRGSVFIVDDNFIGNKRILKRDFLPALIEWAENHDNPFSFTTEVSVNLADDEELMDLMVEAHFKMLFVGIETPDDRSLAECGKLQNTKRDLLESVKILQRRGFVVSGGFILGFDHDQPDIFERQIRFIQESGIVTAMVGLLNAPFGTRLFQRLKSENRIIDSFSGDNMDGSLNFIPRMNRQKLIEGYKKVLRTIFSQEVYFERIKTFLAEYRLPPISSSEKTFQGVRAFIKAIWWLGIIEGGRRFFWKLLFHVLHNHPQKFVGAVRMAIYGFHFRRVVRTI